MHASRAAYYIVNQGVIREPELLSGGRAGPVGSRIVAETLYVLIRNSPRSILATQNWYPQYTSRGLSGTASAHFDMVDLLDFAGVVNPFVD